MSSQKPLSPSALPPSHSRRDYTHTHSHTQTRTEWRGESQSWFVQHPLFLGWHLEVHRRPALKHEHLFVSQAPLQWHLTIPWPPAADVAAAIFLMPSVGMLARRDSSW